MYSNGRIIYFEPWGFELPTFMYGYQIDTYELNILKDVYRVEGTEYEIIGTMKHDEYKNIIKCFATSKSVKNKYRRIFKTLID